VALTDVENTPYPRSPPANPQTDPLQNVKTFLQPSEQFEQKELWESLLTEMKYWKLIFADKTNKDVTAEYPFLQNWQISIRAIRCLWSELKNVGFNCMNIRSFNQDPTENLFGMSRQHCCQNT
jgi:hypothetical protein